MSRVSRYDLLQAVSWHDAEEVRSLLRKAKRQHIPLSDRIYPTLPEVIRSLYNHYPQPGKEPFAERYWKVLPDAAYEILEVLRPFYDFGEYVKLCQNHFLYQPLLHGDVRMLEYLWTLDPLKYRAFQQPLGQLFRAAVEDFCWMRLPDWKGLPHDKDIPADYSLDLGAKDWLETLYAQAERCRISPPEHLEFLLKHDCMLNTSELKLQIHQPHLELREWRYGPSGASRAWAITDSRFTHHQGEDCGEMVKACLRDGEYWPLTCVCGFPECAGVAEPVLSLIFGEVARWRVTASEDDRDPIVYYLAVPVENYLRDMDMQLEVVERGIAEDGFAPHDPEDGPDHPVAEFSASPNSLKKVRSLRELIRRKFSGEEIPEFEKKPEPITIVIDE